MSLKALALNCSLKPSPGTSSTDVMLEQLAGNLQQHGVEVETLRVADYDIKPGVSNDEGNGDQWPVVKDKILGCDILVFGGPVWMGAPSSVAKRVVERLDAILSDTDDSGRALTFGKVAIVAVVGNEDGAHHVSAELYQWLNDTGFTIPAQAVAYWVGEAMQPKDYKDLSEIPAPVRSTQKMAVSNAVHLAELLNNAPYVGVTS